MNTRQSARQVVTGILIILSLRLDLGWSYQGDLSCFQCSAVQCSGQAGPPLPCPEGSQFCVVIKRYNPNLQDDSDANSDENAGRVISMEKACDKTNNASGCKNQKFQGRILVECREYCDHHGCNNTNLLTTNLFTLATISIILTGGIL